ncbi:RNA polymerase sigma factor (sigma-70 family) [Chryseobacterium sp. H1D6B]|uniref:RNA polymerase sigma factor n=1 Tax=Chryseobacterium sp. H1D6B TaxID=2940588 RepID=UPI0015C88E28|nr:RNA polymerase sigma factor [Chryseobacterium sp. H1D6B]MDH6250474.1 RNA polymerase sigma factor (sigma-70 family) [Chryseobacterium sp. H1D6B]
MYSSTDWKKIYNEHSPKLLGICRRYIQDIYTAEDIVQDSFMKAIQNKHQLRDEKLLFAWLKKIVVNQALQHLRKSSRALFITAAEIPDTLSEMNYHDQEDKKHILAYDFTREELLLSIDSLPSHHKSVFNLYCIENYSHAEISSLLGITVNTSKSHLLRAKKALKNYLTHHVLNKNTSKNKKKITQLLIILGFGNMLWAQVFRSKFSDFSIASSKTFKVPDNKINHPSFTPRFGQNLTQKIIISTVLLVVIISSIFLFTPQNSIPVKSESKRAVTVQSKKEDVKGIISVQKNTDAAYPDSSKDQNINQKGIQVKTLEKLQILKENELRSKKKDKSLTLKDTAENTSKKIIIVKKVIQRDTVFVER